MEMVGEGFLEPSENGIEPGGAGGRDDGHQQARAVGEEIVDHQMAFAFWRAALAQGQKLAQMSPGRPIFRPDQDVGRGVHEHQPAARREGEA